MLEYYARYTMIEVIPGEELKIVDESGNLLGQPVDSVEEALAMLRGDEGGDYVLIPVLQRRVKKAK